MLRSPALIAAHPDSRESPSRNSLLVGDFIGFTLSVGDREGQGRARSNRNTRGLVFRADRTQNGDVDDLTLLRLQLEWGADEALDPRPRDRLAAPQAAIAPDTAAVAPIGALQGTSNVELPPVGPVQSEPVGAAARAAGLAAAASTLAQLAASLGGFSGCPLQSTAIHLVFADGSPSAPLMVVGDTPGEDEDRSGRAFSGPGGRLLDQMLGSIGLDRHGARLAYAIPWRPPGNRKATPHERQLCLPFLRRHIALVGPRRLLLLGSAVAASLLDPAPGRSRARGWRELRVDGLDHPIACLATASPEHLIATPAAKREAWADLIALRLALDLDLAAEP